jgi:hypothetical protein
VGFDYWLASNFNSPGVMTVICGSHSDDFLSLHFVAETGPECCTAILPFLVLYFLLLEAQSCSSTWESQHSGVCDFQDLG